MVFVHWQTYKPSMHSPTPQLTKTIRPSVFVGLLLSESNSFLNGNGELLVERLVRLVAW
jgi:hypothetical protein